jgi:hypothetical protein
MRAIATIDADVRPALGCELSSRRFPDRKISQERTAVTRPFFGHMGVDDRGLWRNRSPHTVFLFAARGLRVAAGSVPVDRGAVCSIRSGAM